MDEDTHKDTHKDVVRKDFSERYRKVYEHDQRVTQDAT